MSASMKVDLSFLNKIAAMFSDTVFQKKLKQVVASNGVAAILGHAIAENFMNEGPGWAPLKFRKGRILQKTGLLKKSVTTPGTDFNIHEVNNFTIQWGTKLHYAHIHQYGGTITAQGAKMLWIPLNKKAERIGPLKNKEARKGSGLKVGRDFIFRKSVTIPARPFLILQPEWKERLNNFVVDKANEIIRKAGGK